MDELYLTGIFLFVLFLLLGTGVWIGLALLGVAWVGMTLFTNSPAGDAMITTIWTASSSWALTALPLFIWTGEILFRTRLSEDMFRGLSPWLANWPGRLLHTNVVGCTVFAAVSGSSAATVVTIGKMSIPELRRRGYPERMIVGSLAGAGTLGLMIPPSLIMIVYGVTINELISKLFIAGVLARAGPGGPVHGLRHVLVAPARGPGAAGADHEPARQARAQSFPDSRGLPDPRRPGLDLSRDRDGDRGGRVRRDRRAATGLRPGLADLGKLRHEPHGRDPDFVHDRADPRGRGIPGAGHGVHRPAAGARSSGSPRSSSARSC